MTRAVMLTEYQPTWQGTGPHIRAANTLHTLVRRFPTTLLLAGDRHERLDAETVRSEHPALEGFEIAGKSKTQGMQWPDAELLVVFPPEALFHLRALPLLYPRRILDLDEVKSAREKRTGAIANEAGDIDSARYHLRYSIALRMLERRWIPWFDTVVVSSGAEARRLEALELAQRIEIAPNVRPVAQPVIPPRWSKPLRLLFTGALDYAPNRDALTWFTTEVMPLLNPDHTRTEFLLEIVGPGLDHDLAQRLWGPFTIINGPVSDMRPALERCHIMVCPLRSGAGTRLKIIEAWNHGVPVVTTTMGREGLPGEHAEEFLVADDPRGLAASITTLADQPALAEHLRQRGRACYLAHHTPDILDRAWDRILS